MATTLATLDQSFYQQLISAMIGNAVQTPWMYNFFVFVKDLRQFPTSTWRHTFRNNIADAIVIAELADVTDDAMTDAASEISVETVARSVLVSYEVQRGGTISPNELGLGTIQVVWAHRRKFDDLLWTDTSPGLTNESGSAATLMTFAQHVSFALEAEALWEDVDPVGSVLRCAMHPGPFRHLVNDMVTTEASIFAATFGSMNAASAVAAMGNGGMKNIAGVETFVTSKIPVADTTGKGNVYCLVGSEIGSCFGMAVKWGIDGELRPTEKQLASRVVGSARIGFGILRQDYGLEAITAAA